ncbi:MFS transporter [Nonomuraea sp. NPDC050328]|uniref:MFS transporter n=1 Tax=Nonomuraea sp. NPDC050328 TaxID=3364361 RepID=UPI003789FAAD
MLRSLPTAARTLMWVRILNQLGAYALSFLAVLAGPELAPAALVLFGVMALISRWTGAFLLDRFAPRAVLAAGLAATGVALATLAMAQGPAQVLVAVALVGLAFEIYEPATQELLARASSGEQRHATYAVMGVVLSAAGAVAGLLAAVLLPLGVRWLVVADALTCLTAAVVALACLPRERPAVGHLETSALPGNSPAPSPPPSTSRAFSPSTEPAARQHPSPAAQRDGGRASGIAAAPSLRWRPSLRARLGGRWRVAGGVRQGAWWRPPGVLVWLTVAGTAFAVGYLAVMMYLPLALLERGVAAWVPGLTLAGAAVVAPGALWVARRFLVGRSHGAIIGGGTVLLGVLAVVMGLTSSPEVTIAAYLACTAVNGVLLGRWQSVVADAAPEEERPRWFAFQGSSWGLAQPAVPPLAALAAAAVGAVGSGAFLAAGVAFLLVPFALRRTQGVTA